jgi:hypothetical protein
MKRFIHWILCFFGWHQWFSPLPWHGSFAKAWKRCRWCGREQQDISDEDYNKILRNIKFGKIE